MRIGFDVSQTCASKSGTGFYAEQMAKSFARIDKENEYILFPWFYDYRHPDTDKATRIKQRNFSTTLIKSFTDNDKTIGSLDIIHSNNFRYPGDVKAKKVVTIYDVSFLDCPEFTTEANRLYCYKGTLEAVLNADIIIAISEYTKERLCHFFPTMDKSKVRVVYAGNRETLLAEKDNEKVVKSLGLEKQEYFLSVGTIEPRKNYMTLLAAYKEYKEARIQAGKEYKRLCIAGGYGWLEADFRSKINSLQLSDDVVVTGYVTDEQLANLYRYCYSFVYTTWYEGFGLPVLEAMNFKRPVIASNVTSVPEVTGDAAILVSPEDVSGFSKAMLTLEEDKELYERMMRESYERRTVFSWDKAAQEILKIYEELAGEVR